MFRSLLAHPYEALHKRHLVACVSVMSAACAQPPENEQVMFETCRGLDS
jgi:hypothetical protein